MWLSCGENGQRDKLSKRRREELSQMENERDPKDLHFEMEHQCCNIDCEIEFSYLLYD